MIIKNKKGEPMEKTRVTISLDKDILELLDKAAKEKGLQRSTFLNLYLKESLENGNKEKII